MFCLSIEILFIFTHARRFFFVSSAPSAIPYYVIVIYMCIRYDDKTHHKSKKYVCHSSDMIFVWMTRHCRVQIVIIV